MAIFITLEAFRFIPQILVIFSQNLQANESLRKFYRWASSRDYWKISNY